MQRTALLCCDVCDLLDLQIHCKKTDLPDEDWKWLPSQRAWGNSASADLSSPWCGPTIPSHGGNCFSNHRGWSQVGIRSLPHSKTLDSRRFAVKERGTLIERKSRHKVIDTSIDIQIRVAERIATWQARGALTSFVAQQSIQYFSGERGRGKYRNKEECTKSFLSLASSSNPKHNS